MTETESQQFVSEVLKGFWPDWEPADSMYGLWAKKLRKFDFNKAKNSLGQWFCEAKNTGKRPPINKIIQYLNTQDVRDGRIRKPEPVKAFEIFCEDWTKTQFSVAPFKRKYSFWSSTLHELTCRSPQEIEQEAERARQMYIGWFGGNWIVVREWERYFDRSLL